MSTRIYLSRCLFLFVIQFLIVKGSILKTAPIPQAEQCIVTVGNKTDMKNIGSTWKNPNDVSSCGEVHSCQIDEYGHPTEITTISVCPKHHCNEGYKYQNITGQCCGQCVQVTCDFEGRLYNISDTWPNNDHCTIFECLKDKSSHGTIIMEYKKECPHIPKNCAENNVYQRDCCSFCKTSLTDMPTLDIKNLNNNEDFFTAEYYSRHHCNRDCTFGEKPRVCNYTFIVEWYETLSKACYECPFKMSDCNRPHCVSADGVRRSITIVNRMMPGPSIEVCVNDTIVVDVKNHLLGESTTIHWHGLHQKPNPYMDGVPHVSQCPIQPHTTFRYIFKADNIGTHFWHSHTGMQRGDGVYGALIIRQPKILEPHSRLYDFDLSEHKMIVTDWVHVPGVSMFASHHHSVGDNKPPNILLNGKGRYYPAIFNQKNSDESISSPTEMIEKTIIPDVDWVQSDSHPNMRIETFTTFKLQSSTEWTTLRSQENIFTESVDSQTEIPLIPLNFTEGPSLQEKQKWKRSVDDRFLELFPLETLNVVQGYSYRFRVINAEFLNCPIAISVDKHTILVISSDGYDLNPIEVTGLVTYAGERFDFVLEANQPIGNYWIRLKGLMDCDERFTKAFQVGVIHYEGANNEEPNGVPNYEFTPAGLELNTLNQGSGNVNSLTIAELNSLLTDEDDEWIKQKEPDHKFYVYYDFYPKDNPTFHIENIYGFQQISNNSIKLLTPQLNHISMKMPSLPLMPARDQIGDEMFCNETSLAEQGIDCRKEFCQCHHVIQVALNSIVELIIVDEGVTYDANHPFHLHGNSFRVVGLERVGKNVTIEQIKAMDEAGELKRNLNRPPIKDTVTIPDGGYTIIRFKAHNPGYWLLHCHIEFHAEIGMALVFKVGEHKDMVPIPKNFPQCFDYKPTVSDIFDQDKMSSAADSVCQLRLGNFIRGIYLLLVSVNFFYLFL